MGEDSSRVRAETQVGEVVVVQVDDRCGVDGRRIQLGWTRVGDKDWQGQEGREEENAIGPLGPKLTKENSDRRKLKVTEAPPSSGMQ